MKGQRNYRNIVAWERAHTVTLRVYELSRDFPRPETYGLTSQIRRASFSVAANIAEGSGRETDKDFLRFLYISLGSLKEVEYAALLAHDLDYVSADDYEKLTVQINQAFAALQGLIKSVKKKAGLFGGAVAAIASALILWFQRSTFT